MIKIRITEKELLADIDAEAKNWRTQAVVKTKKVVRQGRVDAKDATWSVIKGVFIRRQHFKCAYCEEPMAKIRDGETKGVGVDYDVEHYRPKNRVTSWPTPEVMERRTSIDYVKHIRSGNPGGYLHLAFEPANYLVSCKLCNSVYKGDRFPITGKPQAKRASKRQLDLLEAPLLLFPFGENGDDPVAYLEFVGATVRPRGKQGATRLRGRVVIDFFELDTREDLFQTRTFVICALWSKLEEAAGKDKELRKLASSYLATITEARFPHAACAREYVQLHGKDREFAKRIYIAASKYWVTKDPKLKAAMATRMAGL